MCTFNSPFGRYRYLRLTFGISSASEIYNRTVHGLFEHKVGVDTSMDDIIVWRHNRADLRIRQVLYTAREVGLRLKRDKCEIGKNQLTFLGDTISAEGLEPDINKVTAIQDIPNLSVRRI